MADGRVLVANRENNRVQIFTADGAYLGAWGELYHPMDIYGDPDGTVFVTDQAPVSSHFHRRARFSADARRRRSTATASGATATAICSCASIPAQSPSWHGYPSRAVGRQADTAALTARGRRPAACSKTTALIGAKLAVRMAHFGAVAVPGRGCRTHRSA
jgi:hypothetical protein